MPPRVPGKKEVLLSFLQRGVAMVHLDARRPGVQVPQQFREEAHLRLNFSYRYGIPDFEVGDEQVRATLSFGGRPFFCVLPWESIFGVTNHDGQGQVWPEDLPVEVSSAAPTERPGAGGAQAEEELRPRPALAAVESDPPVTRDDRQEQQQPPDGPAPKRHLRLVR